MRGDLAVVWLVATLSFALGSPLKCLDCIYQGKRDIFMSRGWGAGGMPFTLVHPNQVKGPTLNELRAEAAEPELEEPSLEYLRARGTEVEEEKGKQPTIPQLFVSYGWGPLGK